MESLIYLVRHGRPDLPDREMRFLGRTDLPLSQEGRQQAAILSEFFSKLAIGRVFHSGMRRAEQTASIIAGDRELPFTAVPELQEIAFGEWELCSMKEMMQKDPLGFESRGKDFAGFRPPGGENFLDVQSRVWPAFQSILDRQEEDIMIVAHAGVFKTIIFTILEMPWQKLFTLRQDYCGVHVLSLYDGHIAVRQLNWTPRIGGIIP